MSFAKRFTYPADATLKVNTAAELWSSIRDQLAHRFDIDFSFRPKPKRDVLPGGFERGVFTEIYGPPSSGRTTLALRAIAHLTHIPEFCAYVDAANTLCPQSAEESGVHLPHLLWVRCSGNTEHALKATDLLLQGGGFGMLVLDLGSVPDREARRISLASWYRLRNLIEKTPTAFVVLERQLNAPSCSSHHIECAPANSLSRPRLL